MRLLKTHEFPKQLLEIPQPPEKLYIEGKLPDIHMIYLTVVGARKHTSYGRDACVKLIEGLKGYPIVIVSGLALGIDTIAHETALKIGLTTVAFPGSGLDQKILYPRLNVKLAEKILENGGALISELEPETPPALWTFPRRNRLMAGIARATLIIEAEEKSGTLITARLATEYNRDVLTLPGSIFSPASKGTNQLLRLGATPVTSSTDILEALGFKVDSNLEPRTLDLVDCSPDEKQILELLREPIPRDTIYEQVKKPIPEINMILSTMEIKGLIQEEYGEIRRV